MQSGHILLGFSLSTILPSQTWIYRLRFHGVITGFNIREESSFGFQSMFGVYSRETISNAVSFSFHFHWGCFFSGGWGWWWILMFMEFQGLAALGTAELCLSRVQFQSRGCQCKLLPTTPPKMSALSWRRGLPKQAELSEPAQFETELWREPKHWTMLSLTQQLRSMLFIRFSSHFVSYFFYHRGSLPSPAKLIDYVLHQHPPLIFTSSGKLHPSHLTLLTRVSLCTHNYYSYSLCPPTGKEALAHQDHLHKY